MSRSTRPLPERPQVITALAIGSVLVLVGLIGPVTGREGTILVFARNYLHDFVHLATGGLGVIAALVAGGRYASLYNRGMGLVYLATFVLGLVFFDVFAELINLNMPDNALHLGLGIVLAGVGFGLGDRWDDVRWR